MENIFMDIGLIIIVATVFAYLAKLAKQPLIPAYIIAGVIIGPYLGLITTQSVIITLSEIGIAFLLFLVGLEMDIRKLKSVGVASVFGGLVQIILVFTIGFILSMILGFIRIEAIYIGIIIAFSSTMIVVKLLSDKREIDTLHGRIIIGILLIQDIVSVLALSVLKNLNDFSIAILFYSLAKGLVMFIIAIIAAKYIYPILFKTVAKSRELLFLMSLTLCFLFAIAFSRWGFSISIGAFIAGLSLANLPYNIEIISIIKPLKDFFATIFFVSLGLELLLGEFRQLLPAIIILTVIVIIIKPLIIMLTTSFFGYKKRVSFQTANSLGQISEFSMIVVAQGLILGHISQDIFSITIILGIVSITLTSYQINYEDKFFRKLKNNLSILDKISDKTKELEYLPKTTFNHIILLGYNRIGYSIAKTVHKLNKRILIVDFNPEVIKKLIAEKVPCIYGDVGDIEILERLNLKKCNMVISTVPTKQDNLLMIHKTKQANRKAKIFVTASQVEEALELYNAGADYVILPHFLGGEHVSILLEDFTGNLNKIIEYKLNHIKELKERQRIGHEHPVHH